MFRGRFEHSIDEKGRLSIPARFRDEVPEGSLVITNFDQCLWAYTQEEWENLERKLLGGPQFDQRTIQFVRYFVSGAAECTLDKAGRALIPPTLRHFAGLERDCVVAGALNKFEIWDKQRWEDSFAGAAARFPSLAEALAGQPAESGPAPMPPLGGLAL